MHPPIPSNLLRSAGDLPSLPAGQVLVCFPAPFQLFSGHICRSAQIYAHLRFTPITHGVSFKYVIGSGDDQCGVIDFAQAVRATLPVANSHGLFGHGLRRDVSQGAEKDFFYALRVT